MEETYHSTREVIRQSPDNIIVHGEILKVIPQDLCNARMPTLATAAIPHSTESSRLRNLGKKKKQEKQL
jgi:hypothetical protein